MCVCTLYHRSCSNKHTLYVSMVHTHMWYVRGYVLGEGGVNASPSIERNSKLEGYKVVFAVMIVLSHKGQVM